MNFKHIIFATIIISTSTFLLCGCGDKAGMSVNKVKKTETIKYVDSDFITDLGKGLEDRWALSDKYDEDEDNAPSERDQLANCVDAELNVLGKKDYPNQQFEDNKLKEKAISYLNSLDDQKEALTYYDVDYSKYEEIWDPAYNERSKLITDFATNYGLSVSDKYQETLSDFATNASLVEEDEEKEQAINNLVDSISFELISDSGGWKEYEAIVENDTGYNIEYLSVDINMIDSDGVNLGYELASMSNVNNGEKAKLGFTTSITDFEKLKVTLDTYTFAD